MYPAKPLIKNKGKIKIFSAPNCLPKEQNPPSELLTRETSPLDSFWEEAKNIRDEESDTHEIGASSTFHGSPCEGSTAWFCESVVWTLERSLRLIVSPDSLSSLNKDQSATEGASPWREGEEKGNEGRTTCRHVTQRTPEAAASPRGAEKETLLRWNFLWKRCKAPRLCGRESFNSFAPAVSCSPLVRVYPGAEFTPLHFWVTLLDRSESQSPRFTVYHFIHVPDAEVTRCEYGLAYETWELSWS